MAAIRGMKRALPEEDEKTSRQGVGDSPRRIQSAAQQWAWLETDYVIAGSVVIGVYGKLPISVCSKQVQRHSHRGERNRCTKSGY